MPFEVLTESAIQRRRRWIDEIAKSSGKFVDDCAQMEHELIAEFDRDGISALLDHLHLCGSIPEHYRHDSSEEKLYSKYTDILLAATLRYIGLSSLVLPERADSADVEAVAENYSLVADAKTFRISRTAKNQKDFKIEALHGWKRGKPHAMVVCPIYQLPTRRSQIYQQAIAQGVCIFTYSHMAVLTEFSDHVGKHEARTLLLKILKCTEVLNPTKDSTSYWSCINREMLGANAEMEPLWQRERLATLDCLAAAKEEALAAIANEREQIMRMSHEEAIKSLIQNRKMDGRERFIRTRSDNNILAIS